MAALAEILSCGSSSTMFRGSTWKGLREHKIGGGGGVDNKKNNKSHYFKHFPGINLRTNQFNITITLFDSTMHTHFVIQPTVILSLHLMCILRLDLRFDQLPPSTLHSVGKVLLSLPQPLGLLGSPWSQWSLYPRPHWIYSTSKYLPCPIQPGLWTARPAIAPQLPLESFHVIGLLDGLPHLGVLTIGFQDGHRKRHK